MKSDENGSIGQAMRRAHQVTSISLEFAIPTGIGVYFDHTTGTSPLWTLVGVLVGSGVAFLSLRQLLRDLEK
ncbi:MAG: AtpZ/AtpI family protein [Planctomycetes bacterium]|nr:AtpZ/AtpI family protein [Planctomycetota bacterium]